MKDKYLFLDRDGTLIREPADEQVDSLDKLEFMPGVFRNLHFITHLLDYKLVVVTNQDGLGSPSYPREKYEEVQQKMLQAFANEGVRFEQVLVDDSFAGDPSPARKPGIGMVEGYLEKDFDREASFVVGDRGTDIELAGNMNLKAIFIKGFADGLPEELRGNCVLEAGHWDEVFRFLKTYGCTATIERETKETSIEGSLALDGMGRSAIQTGLHFFDHMLDQLSRHGGMDLRLKTDGDLEVDEHHTVEDTALALGAALRQAVGNMKGLSRYGFHVPMDDSRATCILDFGGRPYLDWEVTFHREKVGDMPTELFEHFFRSLSDEARCNVHISAKGKNEHHKIEAIFKAFARAVRMAVRQDTTDVSLPTTKGKI
ncbi:MAG TPA: bifunctional histidinol-phosphatase/imidazoleglycerol-phosphate dehydratase HisB [Bacteroidales bacterium]|nr:bifunctional histidinol-phosphatase/imidazoleglycerol-phosphate dehydratase HisB [Bacteroidales bacterium]